MQYVAWHHLACEVPAEWEVSRYAVEPRAGRLEFATRAGLAALFSWEPCRREPDRATTMAGFLATHVLGPKSRTRIAVQELATLDAGPFLVGWHASCRQALALAWLAQPATLLRWVFEDAVREDRLAPWVAPVTDSYRANEGPLRDYALCGIRCRLPAAFEIESMAVYPANVMVLFEGKDKRRATFRRWGLPEHTLGARPLAQVYAGILAADGAVVKSTRAGRVSGCEAVLADFTRRPEHQMERYFGRGWKNGRAVAWRDRVRQRIYAFEQIGPDASPALDFETTLPDWRLE